MAFWLGQLVRIANCHRYTFSAIVLALYGVICHTLGMYLRTTSQTRKDGTVVRYLQLAHNVWDAEKGRSETKVLYNFGREDAENREALERLVRSLTRYLHPRRTEMLALPLPTSPSSSPGLWAVPTCLMPSGGTLGIGETVSRLLAGAAGTAGPNGCSSPWWRTGPSPFLQAGRFGMGDRRSGDPRSSRRPPTTPATGPWTSSWRSPPL